ncbi:MAG: hypothetical protein GC199_00965 [Alphaproteobacteria bacterium]|nr:hypothetical protein [Alphaproteobacteria bacterium]
MKHEQGDAPAPPVKHAQDLVIFDLEFTAWEGSLARNWTGANEFREVVQIGAVRLDRATLRERDQLDVIVRPRRNRQLSDYFIALTGITNERVASEGLDFALALRVFLRFAQGAAIACYGRDDKILRENVSLYGLRNAPIVPEGVNLQPWYSANGLDCAKLHACDIAAACGAAFTGRAHDGRDDSRGLAAGLRALIARGAVFDLA